MDTSLVALWKLDDNWNDSKGSHNLTANNGAAFSTSKKLGTHAGAFDGSDDYAIDGSASSDFAFGTGDFAIAFWQWSSTDGTQQWDMVASTSSNGGSNGGGWFISNADRSSSTDFFLYNGVVNNYVISASESELGITLNDSAWHHYVIEKTSGTVKLYVNGVLKKTNSGYTSSISAGNALRLGGTGDGNYNFAGRLDQFAIWKGKGMTASEVTELYNSGNGKAYDDTNGFATVGPLVLKPIITTGVSSLEIGASGVLVGSETTNPLTLTANSLDTGLVGLYDLNNNYNDSHGSYNGTATSGVTFDSSVKKLGTHSAYFDGTADNRITIGTNASTFNITDEITISAWVYLPSSSWNANTLQPIISSQNQGNGSSTQAGISMNIDRATTRSTWSLSAPTVHLQMADGSWNHLNSTEAIPTGEWVHIVSTRKRGTNDNDAIYYNAVAKGLNRAAQWTDTINWSNANDWAIGAELHPSEARDFHGHIDQVAVWNRILTSAEVTALYNSGSGKTYDTTQTSSVVNGFGTAANVLTKNLITGTTAINDNSWNHIAISRNSGVTRIFAKGTLQSATRTSSETLTSTGIIIGSDSTDVYYLGSMDDIRITKGVGRYTANFTPPIVQNGDVLQVGETVVAQDDIYYTGGKVGFGNTNPDYQVDVTGSVNASGDYFENGVAVETLKRTDAGEGNAKYTGNIEVTGDLKVTSWTIKEEGGNLILVKSDGTKYNFNLTQI